MQRKYWLASAVIIILGVGSFFLARNINTASPDNARPLGNLTWDQLVARHPQELTPPVNRTIYACDDGKSILAQVEIRPQGGGKAEVFLRDGTKMLLTQTISASGVRYANSGESFIFWTKGDTSFIDEGPVRSYANCVAQ